MDLKDIIYIKKCLGKDREPIDIYKFRTMDSNIVYNLETIPPSEIDSFGKIINDARITPLGKFLRRYWVDELPQIYNYLNGDLKLVGMRPKEEEIWERRYPSKMIERALKQKPGLIGISYAFPCTSCFDDELEHTEMYLNQWEKDPVKTDREYLARIFNSVVFRGVRSH